MVASGVTDIHWRKSSYSGNQGACVETAALAAGVAVRDSKFPGRAFLEFRRAEWRDLLTDVRQGRYDLS